MAQDRTFLQEDGVWYRVDRTGRFRVDMRVLSVRFAAGIAGLDAFQRQLPDVGDEIDALRELELVRSNRLGIVDLRIPVGADLFGVLSALRGTGLVEFAEENTFGTYVGIPNDTQFNDQWHHRNTGQTGGTPDADIDADLAWNLTSGDPNVVVSVLDSGTDVMHIDLIDNIWTNSGEIQNNGIDDDNNGFIDDFYGWDFHNGNNVVTGSFWHGTFVAGVVGARTNNSMGVAGIAGGFHPTDGCSVMALGVGDNGPNGSILDDAIIYAADNGSDVITMSLGVGQSAAIDDAIAYAHGTKGVFLDCAAGNTGAFGVAYPATHPLVVSVAATDHNDQRVSFSSVGPENWVSAPGEDIRSTTKNNNYTTSSGTSFSSPLVAGTAGLLLSVLPTLQPLSIQDILKITAKDVGTQGFDTGTGWGRINAHDAVQHVLDSDCNNNGIYDPEDIAAGTSSDGNGNGIPDECELIAYCTAKLNSCGMLPTITGSGIPSATSGSGFTVDATNTGALKAGLLLYSDSGRATFPFSGGTLCLNPAPLKRSSVVIDTGGTPGQCDGSLSIDMNAFAVGTLGGTPLASLTVVGTKLNCQFWGRDTIANGALLSDALEYFVGP